MVEEKEEKEKRSMLEGRETIKRRGRKKDEE